MMRVGSGETHEENVHANDPKRNGLDVRLCRLNRGGTGNVGPKDNRRNDGANEYSAERWLADVLKNIGAGPLPGLGDHEQRRGRKVRQRTANRDVDE